MKASEYDLGIVGFSYKGEQIVKVETTHDLLVHELADLYDAEQQLVRALPKIAKAAHAKELQASLESHLDVTKSQVKRLEAAFKTLDQPAKAEHCDGMAGLIKEAEKALEEDMPAEVLDMAIMASAARVEHYEIAGYTSAITLAIGNGSEEVAELLRESLEEEQSAAEELESSLEQAVGAAEQDRTSSRRSSSSNGGRGSKS